MTDGTTKKRPMRRYRNSQVAIEYLLGHPAATNDDVVKATGCSPRSVTRARAMLVATGQLQRSYFDRQHHTTGPDEALPEPSSGVIPVERPIDPSAMEKALQSDHGPPLTTEQMRERYSAIARYAAKTGEFTLEITALQALGRLDAQTGAKNRLGPGPPLGRIGRLERVKPILKAAGPDVVAEGVIYAFTRVEFEAFVERIGTYMERKAKDEQFIEENRAESLANGPQGDSVPPAVSPDEPPREDGPGSVDDRGEAGPDAGGPGRTTV